MPMALRPGTTATRADSALIDRALSSASPITRDDLMPGAGSSSYSVTTGPGLALTISPRTPKSPSTPSSARELASSSLLLSGCRSEALGAVSTDTDGSSNFSDDLRAGERGFVVFVLEFILVLRRQRWPATAAETGLLAFERGARQRRAGNQRTIGAGQQPAQPRLDAHQRVKQKAQRDRAAALLLFDERRVVVLDRRELFLPGARAPSAGEQEGCGHRAEQDNAEPQAIDKAGRTEHDRRCAHQRVADDAAKPGRQRPGAAMRPAAGKTGRDHHAQDPAAKPQRFAIEGAAGQHAPAPDRDRQDQHDRAKSQNLHQEIGADRAGVAEDVADRARGGVT